MTDQTQLTTYTNVNSSNVGEYVGDGQESSFRLSIYPKNQNNVAAIDDTVPENTNALRGTDGRVWILDGLASGVISAFNETTRITKIGETEYKLTSQGILRRPSIAAAKADVNIKLWDYVTTEAALEGWASLTDIPRGGNKYLVYPGGTKTADGCSVVNMDNGLQMIALFPQGIRPEHFLASGNGSDDDFDAFEKMIAYAMSESFNGNHPKGTKIHLYNTTYKINDKLTINPQLISFVGNHSELDFSSSTSTTAIHLRGIGTAGADIVDNRYKTALKNLKLVGKSGMTLLDISSDSGSQDSRGINIKNVNFKDFSIGINLGSNGWGFRMDGGAFNGTVENCIHINEESDSTATNLGEANRFENVMFTGYGTAFKSGNYNSDNVIGGNSSLDCEQGCILSRGAVLSIENTHIESSYDTKDFFVVDDDTSGLGGTLLRLLNCKLQIIGTSRTNDWFACAKSNPVNGGGIVIENLDIKGGTGGNYNWATPLLIGGNGPVSIKSLFYAGSPLQITLAESLNRLTNGSFTSNSLGNLVAADTNYPPAISTTRPRTGTYCLELTPLGSANIGVTKTENIRPGQKAFFGLYYKLESVVNGGKSYQAFNLQYSIKDDQGNELKSEEKYYEGTNDYSYFSFDTLTSEPMPKGASKITFQIVLYGATSGTARVDNMRINIID